MSKIAKKTKKYAKPLSQWLKLFCKHKLQVAHHFPCPIYIIERPDFLETLNTVSEEALKSSTYSAKSLMRFIRYT